MMTETQAPATDNNRVSQTHVNNSTTTNNAQPATVKTDPGQTQGSLAWLKINLVYFRTLPGIVKLVELLFGVICMACASPARLPGTHWFLFVVVSAFILTLIWVFIYFLSIKDALKLPVDWIATELIYTAVFTLLYFIAFIVQLAVWSGYSSLLSIRNSNVAAGCFGLFNFLAYAAGTFFLYKEWRLSVTGAQ